MSLGWAREAGAGGVGRTGAGAGGVGGTGAGGVGKAESLKAATTANTVRGKFWTSGEHFGPKFMLFCRICSFVANHAP